MINKEWLSGLKVGDKVVIHSKYYNTITKIDRLTPTQFVMPNGIKFNRNDGYQVGSGDSYYGRNCIGEVTDQIINNIKKQKLIAKIGDIKLQDLTLEQLNAINDVLDGEN